MTLRPVGATIGPADLARLAAPRSGCFAGNGCGGAAAAALGAIHDRGEGVTRNLATAAIWYEVAVDHGDEIAAERLEELRAETRDIFKGMRFV